MRFLDANASVPPVSEALAALVDVATSTAGHNPSSPHSLGRAARRHLDLARDRVGVAMGARSSEVFFVAGASEANRFAVDLLIEAGDHRGRPLRVVTSALEHPSIHKALTRAQARDLLDVATLPTTPDGIVIDAALLADADAVIVTAAHNETGLLTDLAAIAAPLRDDAVFVVDAAQSLGRLPAPPPARADVVTASAHKLGGVVGAGALVLRGRARDIPLPWAGGGQEQGVRPGTEATPAIAAFGAAAAVIERTRAAHQALAAIRDRLERAVVDAGGVAIGAGAPRLPNTSAVLLPDVDGDALRMMLDRAGLCVGFGAACSAMAPEPSPGLMALGLVAADTRRVVRLSLAPATETDDDEAELARTQAALLEVIARLR